MVEPIRIRFLNALDPEDEEPAQLPAAPPEATPFDPWERAGDLGAVQQARSAQEEREKARDLGGADLGPPAYADPKWKGLHGYAGPWEDERGQSLPELDLKAQFLRSQGEYGAYPRRKVGEISSWEPEDTPIRGPLAPGASDLPQKGDPASLLAYHTLKYLQGQASVSGHDTPLDDINDANRYLDWAHKGGKNTSEEEQDYDLRGYYKAGGKLTPGAHLPDTFKKPSHPTFSEESKYSGPGNEGGKWIKDKKGNYLGFQPGPANLQYRTPEQIQEYFDKYEPGLKLYWPPGTEGAPASFEDRFPRGTVLEAPAVKPAKPKKGRGK